MDKYRKFLPLTTFTAVLILGLWFTRGSGALLGAADGSSLSSGGVEVEQFHPCTQIVAAQLRGFRYLGVNYQLAMSLREEAESLSNEVVSEHLAFEQLENNGREPYYVLSDDFLSRIAIVEEVFNRTAEARAIAARELRDLDPNNPVDRAVLLALILVNTLGSVHVAQLPEAERAYYLAYSEFQTWVRENPDAADLAYKKLALVSAMRLVMYADIHQEDCGPAVVGEVSSLERAVHEILASGVNLFNTPGQTPEEQEAEEVLLSASLRVLSELRLAKQADELAREEEFRLQSEARQREAEERRRAEAEAREAARLAAEAAAANATPTPVPADTYIPIPEPTEEYDAPVPDAADPTPQPTVEYDAPVPDADEPAPSPTAQATAKAAFSLSTTPLKSKPISAKPLTNSFSTKLSSSVYKTPTPKPTIKKLFVTKPLK